MSVFPHLDIPFFQSLDLFLKSQNLNLNQIYTQTPVHPNSLPLQIRNIDYEKFSSII